MMMTTTTTFPPSEPRSHRPSCEVVGPERALRRHPVRFYVDCLFEQLDPRHFSHLLTTSPPLYHHSANLDLLKNGHSRASEALSLLFPNHYIVARCLSLSLSLPSCHHVQRRRLLLLYIVYYQNSLICLRKNIRQTTIVCYIAQSLWTLSKVMRPSVLKPLDRSLRVYTAYSRLRSRSTALGNTKLGPALYHLHPHMCIYAYSFDFTDGA